MKIVKCNKECSTSINFVDINNVFVGYDLTQDCCEHANWYISSAITDRTVDTDDSRIDELNKELEDFSFIPNFFQTLITENETEECDETEEYNEIAIFRMIDSIGNEKFLHLFNCHNGYYTHKFVVKRDGEIIKTDRL